MGSLSKIVASQAIKSWLFAFICATLPWIEMFRISTLLWIPLGILCILSGKSYLKRISFFTSPLLLLFSGFYALQIAGVVAFPDSPENIFSLEQKASFLLIPILLSLLLQMVPGVWHWGVRGFITGVSAAMLYCLTHAIIHFVQTGDTSVFFYHHYGSAINANAIYASLYVCIAIYSLLFYYQRGKIRVPFLAIIFLVFFLYGNLLLLSSKMIILSGSVFLACLLWLTISSVRGKALGTGSIIVMLFLIFSSKNPIQERFTRIDIEKYKTVLSASNFSHYPFTGFDLRLLLLRMGYELLQESDSWLFGTGGRHYHVLPYVYGQPHNG